MSKVYGIDPEKLQNQSAVQTTESVIDSRTLFAGRREITILHKGIPYHLKITRFDRLILNK